MMDILCHWMSAVAAGDVQLPDEATQRREIERETARRARRYPSTPRYGLELDPREYTDLLQTDLRAAHDDARSGSGPVHQPFQAR